LKKCPVLSLGSSKFPTIFVNAIQYSVCKVEYPPAFNNGLHTIDEAVRVHIWHHTEGKVLQAFFMLFLTVITQDLSADLGKQILLVIGIQL
jgi:hypothetical protein